MQEKLFIQYVCSSLFPTKNANDFYFKINDSSRLKTTRFSSGRFGIRVTVVSNSFTIYPYHISTPENSETLKGSPTNIFGTVRQKKFDGKSCYSPLFIHKVFRYRKFSETQHRTVPLRNFSALWDEKKFDGKSCYSPLLIHKVCRYRNFSETQHRRVPLRNFSALWDKKTSTENLVTPPFLSIKFFATGIFLKHSTEEFPYDFFRHCGTKNFRRKFLIPPPSYL